MVDALGTLAQAALALDRGLYGAGPVIAYPQVPGASDMGAGNQIHFTSAADQVGHDREDDMTLVGASAAQGSDLVAQPVTLTLNDHFHYRTWERIFYAALGFEHPALSPVFLGTGDGTKAVTNTTNATPIVVSVATHGYSNGDGIQIAGVTGNTNANGDWVIAGVTAGTFELVGSQGNGAHGGSPTAEKYFAAAHLFEPDNPLQDDSWQAGEVGNYAMPSALDKKVRRFQLGFDKQVSDWVYNSLFVNKLTISGDSRGLSIAAELIGYRKYRGSYNSGAWTLPTGVTSRILFGHGAIKLGLQAVEPSALQSVENFELVVDNKLKGDDQTVESGNFIEIPVRDGVRDIALKLNYPRYSDDTEMTYFDTDLAMACSLIFTGPTIAGGSAVPYSWKFLLPNLAWRGNPSAQVGGPSRLDRSFEFGAEKPVAAGLTDPFIGGAGAHHEGITLIKDPELVVVTHNEDMAAYSTEV